MGQERCDKWMPRKKTTCARTLGHGGPCKCWRGTARQAQLARFLAGCEVESLDDARARATGTLAGRARSADIVDVNVVEGALRRGDFIISSDEGDLAAIAAAIGRHVDVEHP
jgi:hypothetical protein